MSANFAQTVADVGDIINHVAGMRYTQADIEGKTPDQKRYIVQTLKDLAIEMETRGEIVDALICIQNSLFVSKNVYGLQSPQTTEITSILLRLCMRTVGIQLA